MRVSTLGGGTQKTLRADPDGTDLTAAATQFCFLKVSDNQYVDLCGAGEMMVGVQQQLAIGAAVMYRACGGGATSKLKVDGTTDIVAGDRLASDAEGRGVTAAAGDYYGAIALEGCTFEDGIIEVQLVGPSVEPA